MYLFLKRIPIDEQRTVEFVEHIEKPVPHQEKLKGSDIIIDLSEDEYEVLAS
jgi:hypothetical protein